MSTPEEAIAQRVPRQHRNIYPLFTETLQKALFQPQRSHTAQEKKWLKEIRATTLAQSALRKSGSTAGGSNQEAYVGIRQHPFNFTFVDQLKNQNEHHAACIRAKVSSAVGLGFQSPADKARIQAQTLGQPIPDFTNDPLSEIAKIDMLLDPLCLNSWSDVLASAIEDYFSKGNGFIEVVRRGDPKNPAGLRGSEIVGLHWIPARDAYIVLANRQGTKIFFEIHSAGEGAARAFAPFGKTDTFSGRRIGQFVSPGTPLPGENPFGREGDTAGTFSEVIHFRASSTQSRWYGYPDYLSAVPSAELQQMLRQHEFDFYLNRAVPEFMLFLMGAKLNPKDRERINTAMASTVGLGNQGKSVFLELAGSSKDIKIQLEKLAIESKSDSSQFSGMSETLGLSIVSAHGVPPLLAGIQIPGKLGAANELPQAMTGFQNLVIAPHQRAIMKTLMKTLGNPTCNGGLELQLEDFALNTILDQLDLKALDTMSRMRQSPQEAQAEGRNLDDGVKE